MMGLKFYLSFLLLLSAVKLRANPVSPLEQRQRLSYFIYSELINSVKSQEQFFKLFSVGMNAKDKLAFRSLLRPFKKIPRVEVNNQNQLIITQGRHKLTVDISKDTPNMFFIGKQQWVYDPSAPYITSYKILMEKLGLHQSAKKSSSVFHLFVPEANAFVWFAPLGMALLTVARSAAPYILSGGIAGARLIGAGIGKMVESTGPAVVGGVVSSAFFISRQEKIPYKKALVCMFSDYKDDYCSDETVVAKIAELASESENIDQSVHECPYIENRTFSYTSYNSKKNTKLTRLVSFNPEGIITEMLEFSSSKETRIDGKDIFKVNPENIVAYQFDVEGKLEKVRKATFNEMVPYQRFGNSQSLMRPALIVEGINLTEEQKLVFFKNRNKWLNDNRVRKSEENIEAETILMDRNTFDKTDPNDADTWKLYKNNVKQMNDVRSVICDNPISTAVLPRGTGFNDGEQIK